MSRPQYPIITTTALDRYIGPVNSPGIPCAPGDLFTLTATIQYLSGNMQARIVIGFFSLNLDTYYGGIIFAAPNTDNGWHIASLTATAPAGAQIAQVSSNCEYLEVEGEQSYSQFVGIPTAPAATYTPTPTTWAISNYRVVQNGVLLSAPMNDVTTNGGAGPTSTLASQEFVFPLYYMGLIAPQYALASNMYSQLATRVGVATDYLAFVQQMWASFDLNTAIGDQLDFLGQIVGVSRVLPFQPSVGAFNAITTAPFTSGAGVTVEVNTTIGAAIGDPVVINSGFDRNVGGSIISFTSSSFIANLVPSGLTIPAGSTVISTGVNLNPTLDDADYLTLLTAKIAKNKWNGSIAQIYALWNTIFPGGRLIFIDNQDMTCELVLGAALTAIQQQMITNDLIIPRPQAVLYNYSFAELPIFGLDQNNATIAGLDTGHLV